MILIVDDQWDTISALERLLRFAGHDVVAASGGKQALAVLQQRRPSLVILDMHMPEMDGQAVLEAIRSDEAMAGVKVAIYSADSNAKLVAATKKLGALDFLVKGVMPLEALVRRVSELASELPGETMEAV